MSLFVADPDWGWWIVLYFFFGGIAAGLYFLAAAVSLFGRREDYPLIRTAHLLAFPLISLCGLFLIVDLNRPERFWHMMLQSEVVALAFEDGWPATGDGWAWLLEAPLLKTWSPMSIGAWAVLLFGLFSLLSFAAAVRPRGWLTRLLVHGAFGKVFQVLGAGIGFFVASYTGVLLTATNQPVWSQSEWVGALFLTSAASTGVALLLLITSRRGGAFAETRERLERAELWALVLETAVFLLFLASLGTGVFLLMATWYGRVLVFGTLLVGMMAPLYLQLGAAKSHTLLAPVLALVGGFLLRLCILGAPGEFLEHRTALTEGADSLTGIWRITFLLAMLVMLAMICSALYRRAASSRGQRVAAGGLFAVCALLLVWHTATTYEQRQEFWAALPMTISPEVDRLRGGGAGGGPFNQPTTVQPRSKVFLENRDGTDTE
jgi:formate-dependent nitrite reductase membrane component NrfD